MVLALVILVPITLTGSAAARVAGDKYQHTGGCYKGRWRAYRQSKRGAGLKGKTALVLGGGSGLGKGIALSLAREGARVAIAGRTQATLDATVKEIEAAGSEGRAL